MSKLVEQYNKVFDPSGRILFCGRDECIKLIELFEEQFPGVDFGNKGNGFLNVKNIKEYRPKVTE